MKLLLGACALTAFLIGSAAAQTGATKQTPPSPSGAESNMYTRGVARDPSEVKAQQGDASKSAPGTVGAAPGADTPSQKPK